jgi:D-alanyl-D-alanine dipeptidase
MAIDVCLIDKDGHDIDMGTPFDEMSEKSARNYQGFSEEILQNRKMLENAFIQSAKELSLEIFPLPSEWWDFRFLAHTYDQYAPLHDHDLPPQMRMVSTDGPDIPDFPDTHFDTLKNDILASLN